MAHWIKGSAVAELWWHGGEVWKTACVLCPLVWCWSFTEVGFWTLPMLLSSSLPHRWRGQPQWAGDGYFPSHTQKDTGGWDWTDPPPTSGSSDKTQQVRLQLNTDRSWIKMVQLAIFQFMMCKSYTRSVETILQILNVGLFSGWWYVMVHSLATLGSGSSHSSQLTMQSWGPIKHALYRVLCC